MKGGEYMMEENERRDEKATKKVERRENMAKGEMRGGKERNGEKEG